MSSLKMTLPHYLILALTTRSAMGSKLPFGLARPGVRFRLNTMIRSVQRAAEARERDQRVDCSAVRNQMPFLRIE